MFSAVDRANMSLRNDAYKQTKEGKNWMKIRCAAERRRERRNIFRSAVRNAMCACSNSALSLPHVMFRSLRVEGRTMIFIVVAQRHTLSRHLTFAPLLCRLQTKNLQTSIFLLLGRPALFEPFFSVNHHSLWQSSFNYFIDCGWWIVTIGAARLRSVDNWEFTFSSSIN